MSTHTQPSQPGVFMSENRSALPPQPTLGLAIVGEAQAGKTFARGIMHEVWGELQSGSPVYDFSNSNGYRGLTLDALEHGGASHDEEVPAERFAGFLRSFLDTRAGSLPAILDGYYANPRPTAELRCHAIKSTVAVTSEIPDVRKLINSAGARFLGNVMCSPELVGLQEKPGLVVIDGRNAQECREKYQAAGVMSVGAVVMTCPPEVAARRSLSYDASEKDIKLEAARLADRNKTDRARLAGPMTLPEDYANPMHLDAVLGLLDPTEAIRNAGGRLVIDPNTCLVIPTDLVSKPEEQSSIQNLFAGILTTVAITTR